MSFFTELKRRNVFRIGAAYVVTSWLLIEATETIFPLFGFNQTPARIVVIVLAIAFVPALAFTWVFEITPEGLKKEKDVDRSQSITHVTGRKLDFAIIGLLAIALIVITGNWFMGRDARWARDEAFPEIEEYADAGVWEAAYALAKQVDARLPDEPTLAELWPTFSWTTTISSDPSGAKVYRRPYTSNDAKWEELGMTPLDDIHFPYGLSLIRFELDGHSPILRLHGRSSFVMPTWRFRDPPRFTDEPFPQDMVRVNSWSQVIDGEMTEFRDFFIGRHEVTNGEYQEFVDANGYEDRTHWQELIQDGRSVSWEEAIAQFIDQTGRRGPGTWYAGTFPDGKKDYPVSGVSWYEAAAYARFRGRELPTYHHWRRAFGRSENLRWMLPASNLEGDGPAPKGQFQGISWPGAFDMAGNVREWCINSTGNERVILGGGWEDAYYVVWESINDRSTLPPLNRHPTNGFRLAMTSDVPVSRQRAAQPLPESVPEIFVVGEPLSDDLFAAYQRDYDYDQTPLNASVEAIETSRNWTRERITFDAAYGNERVTLYLHLPRGHSSPYQTIVFFPGSSAMSLTSLEQRGAGLDLDFALKNGRAVAYPVYKGTYERRLPARPSWGSIAGRDLAIQQIKDLRRTIDYLEKRADIDATKLAYHGFSLGGRMGGIILAVEPRLKVGILDQAGFESGIHSDIDVIKFLPRVTVPVLQFNGRYDGDFRYETDALPFFALIGTPEEHKKHVVEQSSHYTSYPVIVGETLSWLDRYLGPPD